MARILFGMLLLLTLAACSSTVPSELRTGNKRLVVLSFMGNSYNALENTRPSDASIQQQYDRMTASLNSMEAGDYGYWGLLDGSEMRTWRHDVTDWGIDRSAVGKTIDLLAGKYQIVEFAYDPASLAYQGDFKAFVNHSSGELAEAIRRQPGFAQVQGVDAYIILLPAQEGFTIFDQRWSYGVGMTRDFLAFEPDGTYIVEDGVYILHALYNVVVLDGHSLEQLAVVVADHDTLYRKRFRGNPAIFVDKSYWAESYDQFTDAQRQKIVDRVNEMIDATLPGTLQEVGLLP